MRRFVADFLLPIVRGGPAHVGRPLGLDAVLRMLRDPFPIAEAGLELASIGAPTTARDAINRHSLLARLPEIVRVDRTVHFWLGRQTFVGRRPPPRVTSMPKLRR